VRSHQSETNIPADVLLIQGTCIVNEAMLSGESTPLLKESIELLDANDKLDADGQHKNTVLFSGTKLLQGSNGGVYISALPFVLIFILLPLL
jgi:cation-transporting ATPase 13A1